MVTGKTKKIQAVITVVLLLLAVFANFYTIGQMKNYGLRVYFYDKLLVAYDMAQAAGLKAEIERMLSQPQAKLQFELAQNFKEELIDIRDPGGYLKDMVDKGKEKIALMQTLRLISFGLIALILLLRLALFSHGRK